MDRRIIKNACAIPEDGKLKALRSFLHNVIVSGQTDTLKHITDIFQAIAVGYGYSTANNHEYILGLTEEEQIVEWENYVFEYFKWLKQKVDE